MALPKPTEFGPAFWETRYGYSTFDEFFTAAGPLVSGIGAFGISPPDELVARLAWFSPGSGVGIYVAGRLAEATDGSPALPFSAWASAAREALQIEASSTMATLIIPNAFQVSIEAEAGGQPIFNVIGVTNAGGTAAGAAAAVKAAWETGATSPLARLSSLVTMRNYRAVDLSSAFGDIAEVPGSASGGTAAAALSTLAASALVQWNGSTRSRSTRGRLYFGPLTETNLNSDGRTLPTATRDAFQATFDTFRSSLASAGYPLAVLSRKNSAAYPVSSHVVEGVIATQRRRLR